MLFFLVSEIQGLRSFHVEKLVEISSATLVDDFVGNEGWNSIILGIQTAKPTEIGVLIIENDEKEILSDLGQFKLSLKSDFADKFLFINVVDFNVRGIRDIVGQAKEIPVAVDGDRVFNVIDFKSFFILSCLFDAIYSDQLLARIDIWTDYF